MRLSVVWAVFILVSTLEAIPAFARKYGVTCNLCHKAYPKLSAFGENFADGGYLIGDGKQGTRDVGDPMLNLYESVPLALRFVAWGEARNFGEAKVDFQAPYFAKVLTGGPLGQMANFYAYIIFEKGEPPKFEDAWINIHHKGWGLTLGQFQISDLMFLRETRLTRSDFMVYRVAPAQNRFALTYHRGVLLSIPFLDATLGVVNGNGIGEAEPIQDVGSGRPYRDFDNNTAKVFFGHFSLPFAPLGFFGLMGQDSIPDDQNILRENRFIRAGLDLKVDRGNWDLFWQFLWGQDSNPLYEANPQKATFYGGFLGVDHTGNFPWTYSLLINFVETSSGIPNYRKIRTRTVSLNLSRYLYRNARVYVEGQIDLLTPEEGIRTRREHLFTLGIDWAF